MALNDRSAQAALALSAPLAAFAAGAIGASIADALSLRSVDARYVAITLAAAMALLAFRLTRPGSPRWARIAHAVLAAPIVVTPFLPHSSLFVGWLTGGVLSLLVGAGIHATRTAWRAGSHRLSRFALAASSAALTSWFFFAALVVLANMQLVVAPIKLAHQTPIRHEGEEEIVLRSCA